MRIRSALVVSSFFVSSLFGCSGSGDSVVTVEDSGSVTTDSSSDAPHDSTPETKDAATDTAKDSPGDTSSDTTPTDVSTDTTPSDTSTDTIVGDTGCPAPEPGVLHVDGALAPFLPSHNGSRTCPLKTITEALDTFAATGAKGDVQIAPGTYNAALGERFPLQIPAGTTVEGDITASAARADFVIDGHGAALGSTIDATVVLSGTLQLLTLTDSTASAPQIVYASTGAPHMKLVTVQGGIDGIVLAGQVGAASGTTLTIDTQCEVRNATTDGLVVDPGLAGMAPSLAATGMKIHDNGADGVHVKKGTISVANVDLGTACPEGAPNLIYCNGRYGIESDVGTTAKARSVQWDHATPKSGGSPADVDSATRVDVTCNGVSAPGACMK